MPMRVDCIHRASLLFTAAVLTAFAQPLAAQTSHPLWQQTRQHLQDLSSLAAGQVDYRVSQQGAGRRAQYRAIERLQGWDGTQPRRHWVSARDSALQGLAEALPPPGFNPADHPDRVLLEIDAAEPAGVEARGNILAQAFDIRGHLDACESLAGSQQEHKLSFRGRVWVQQDSGAPLSLAYQVEGLPFVSEFSYQVYFAPDERWQRHLPSQALLTITTRLPLIGSSTVDRQLRFSDWQERPQ
ncbi:hypothetical protein ACS5PK_21600 [Roseateles sp. DB2]|uniref:hypothetical protein n=1 Tax=Roseateles sp. DB2 TaxID=3453717 RepID=UPI003EEC583D